MSIAASSSRLSTADAMKWASNFVSSVAIVMVNKQLMGASGLAFQYATTLCGMHFLCTMSVRWCRPRGAAAAAARAEAAKGGRELPQKKLLAFVAVASTSIISLNLSLMLNHVGFYQLAKLLQIPAVCLIEVAFFGRKVSWALARAIGVVMFGVGIATLQETTMNFWGTIVAAIAVLSTSAQQILVSRLQSEYSISSNDLLGRTAPLMALAMLTVGPFLDQILTGSFITDYYWTGESVMFLSASCLLAIWVNISQYMCIGTFQRVVFSSHRPRQNGVHLLLRLALVRHSRDLEQRHRWVSGYRGDIVLLPHRLAGKRERGADETTACEASRSQG